VRGLKEEGTVLGGKNRKQKIKPTDESGNKSRKKHHIHAPREHKHKKRRGMPLHSCKGRGEGCEGDPRGEGVEPVRPKAEGESWERQEKKGRGSNLPIK